MFGRYEHKDYLAKSTFFSGLSWVKGAFTIAVLTVLSVPPKSFAQPVQINGAIVASGPSCTRSYSKDSKWGSYNITVNAELSLGEGSTQLATVTTDEVDVNSGKGLIMSFALYGSSSVSGGFGYQINNLVLNEATETARGERVGRSKFFQGHETQLGRIYLDRSSQGDLSSLCNNLLDLYERGIVK